MGAEVIDAIFGLFRRDEKLEPIDVVERLGQLAAAQPAPRITANTWAPAWRVDAINDLVVCQHGVASDVHCCNCHHGFLFDPRTCVCNLKGDQ